jgi:DNA repair protein SbcC/Rad50
MIPIKLTIQGLYSYQKKQSIDFSRLTAAHLFGIFGPVGCGKSSVLEAIIFALYGQTDRLNQRDNRNYNMMNLKSNELLIDFIFETGKEQTRYRAVVKGRRNSRQFDEVNKLDRTAYKSENDSWKPVECSELTDAIGLSYENFKRTIIIPQGQFQEFLQLGNRDRTQMMKELFNLGKFELYYKVTSLETKNNEQIQHIQGQLQQVGEVDTEKLKSFEEELAQLKEEIAEQDEKLKTLQHEEVIWKQIQELAVKLETAKKILSNLKENEPAFIQLEKSITQYENCVARFQNILDSLDLSDKKIVQKTAQIDFESHQKEILETEIATNDKILAEIKPLWEGRELLKQQADELEKLLKIKTLVRKIEKENNRLLKGNEILVETTEAVEKFKSIKNNLEHSVKEYKSKLPDFTLLSDAKAWHTENLSLEKQLAGVKDEIKNIENEINTLNQAIQHLFSDPAFTDLPEKSDIRKTIQFMCDEVEKIQLKIKATDEEASHFRVKEKLEEYAKELKDGKPCPLCGSGHHPEKYSAASNQHELIRLKSARLNFEKEITKLQESIAQLKEQENQLKFLTRNINERLANQTTLTEKISAHQSQFQWNGYNDLQMVEKAFKVAGEIQNEIKTKESQLHENSLKLDSAQTDKERFQAEIEKIKTARIVFQTEVTTLEQQLKIINPVHYQNKTTEEIESNKTILLQKYAQLEKQFGELTRLVAELCKTRDTLAGSLNTNKKELVLAQDENVAWKIQLDQQLELSEFSTADEVKKILALTFDLSKQKNKLADFKHDFSLAQLKVNELKLELGNRVYDAEAHKKLIIEMKATGELLNRKNQEFGKTAELLKKLLKDMESRERLEKALEKLAFRAENLKTMKSLFKASGFVNYVSSVYLQNLCHAANDRFFQLTRQKLSLEITEDNSFQVRDFMNGGKVRNVKTLSGGQTFQAALSLALALADNIQKITESNQNFFFLDEGFGSLDKDSLAVVFDTLKSLRKENRIAGVISHVEEMQQEIDVHLRIENDEEYGSIIHRSWME